MFFWLIPLLLASSSNRHDETSVKDAYSSRYHVDERNENHYLGSSIRTDSSINTRTAAAPVVGILSQPFIANKKNYKNVQDFHNDNDDLLGNKSDYIAASYVKWLEAGGARSIPIPYDADPTLIDDIYTQINAVFLPGGSAPMPPAVPYLLQKIVTSNDRGYYFPVWGTCLGFEFLISHFAASPTALQSGFDAENITLALEHVVPQQLYRHPRTYQTVLERNVTMNNHEQGIEPERFQVDAKLRSLWNVTSINQDANGRPFVSTIEPHDPDRFPMYGVQYHPEKNAFEYATYPGTNIPYENIDHSEAGIAFSMHLARFFVDLVRRGQITNPMHEYTKSSLYPTMNEYPIRTGLKFEQIYILPKASFWKKNRSSSGSNSNNQTQAHVSGTTPVTTKQAHLRYTRMGS
jgi:gamma-glutamyl hydrolase